MKNLKNILLPSLVLAAKSLFFSPQPAIAQSLDFGGFNPKAEVTFLDETSDLGSSLNLSVGAGKVLVDLDFNLEDDKIKQDFGAEFTINKDPVWSVINGGLKYGFEWTPFDFIKQDFQTFTGYQNISNIKVPFLYHAGQFFTGGEENLSFVLGNEKINLEATGTLGGYCTLGQGVFTWDNYKAGYNVTGNLSLSPFEFNAFFNQMYTQFNKDKYFFIDSSNTINLGANVKVDLEELVLDASFKKEYTSGKELDKEKIYVDGNLLFTEPGFGLRTSVELNQLFPDEWKFTLAGGKTILDNTGYLELSFGLTNNDNPFVGIWFRSSSNENANKIIKKKSRENVPLIEQQGYEKLSDDLETAVHEIDTLTKIGNTGIYINYGLGTPEVRTPEQTWDNGFGDCDELARLKTFLARENGFEDSWCIGYYDEDIFRGHGFFLVRDTDGRIYVTDNDHGAYLRVNVDADASREEMAREAVEQLARYMALMIPEGDDGSYLIFDEDGNVVASEDFSNFQTSNPDYVPIDTGLMSRLGEDSFYSKTKP